MSCMFAGCNSLSNIDLSNFNTKNVNDMSCIFAECNSLRKKIIFKLNNH
jgi:surface protein